MLLNAIKIAGSRLTGKPEKNAKNEENPKLRVAAYCRVSKDSDEQATSYEVQIEHYTNYIQSNSEWELAGIYADDGITGTSTKNREEFNRKWGWLWICLTDIIGSKVAAMGIGFTVTSVLSMV